MELSRRRSLPIGRWVLLSVFILIFAYIRWEDVVIQRPDGSYSIDDATADKVDDRVDRIRNRTEFYRLVAENDGYFQCPLCPPEAVTNSRYFLYYGEVYKYGITLDKKSRYSKSELLKWNLRYEVIAIGDHAEMLVLETYHMGQYPLLPENLKREKFRRLATPPGSGTRLR